jgi:hypothetical protein
MPDRDAVLAALAEYARKPATSHECRAGAGEIFGARPLVNLMRLAQSLDTLEEVSALLAEVAPLIRAEDRLRAGAIALSCGSVVEMGCDPGLVFPHMLAALPHHLALARRAQDLKKAPKDDVFPGDPQAARALAGLSYLLLCTMTVICRRMEFRQALRANADVVAGIAALRAHSGEADFVAQVLALTDGVELIVLAPQEGRGFRFALEAVNNNFHLFTLLQAALTLGEHLPGEPPEPELLGLATGEAPQPTARVDHARWHFYSWEGLQPDGGFAATDFRAWLPGDASPTDIPRLADSRIVVIGPTVLGRRSWSSNEFACIHDALRSRAELVEVLSEGEVAKWVEKLRQARE